MAFWNLAESEPRRAHRFLLSIPALGTVLSPGLASTTSGTSTIGSSNTYHEYLCKTVTKPSYTISETEHKFLGNTYYYPGAVAWDAVSAQLVNSKTPDGNELLYKALGASGWMNPDDQAAFFNTGPTAGTGAGPWTPNKKDALAALGSVKIKELDGTGELIGTWELKNPFITSVKFGDLDYSSEELLNIDITFRYDFAIYGSGVVSS